MRRIAIALNCLLIIVIGSLLASSGVPVSAKEVAMLAVFFAAPITSLLALLRLGSSPDSLIGLKLRRMALEEQGKIDKLREAQTAAMHRG